MRSFPSSASGAESPGSRTTSAVPYWKHIHSMSSNAKRAIRSLEATTTADTRPSLTSPKTRKSPGLLKLSPEPTSLTGIWLDREYLSGRLSRRYCCCRSRSSRCLEEETRAYRTTEQSRRAQVFATVAGAMLVMSKRRMPPGLRTVSILPALSHSRSTLLDTPSSRAAAEILRSGIASMSP